MLANVSYNGVDRYLLVVDLGGSKVTPSQYLKMARL